jgi:hypothetical protein
VNITRKWFFLKAVISCQEVKISEVQIFSDGTVQESFERNQGPFGNNAKIGKSTKLRFFALVNVMKGVYSFQESML